MPASVPPKSPWKRKCPHCSEVYVPDRRNRRHQVFCSKPSCRQRSKALSQRRWQQKPANRDYFRGSENTARVQQWRRSHPGYWRRQAQAEAPLQEVSSVALQDVCPPQASPVEPLARDVVSAPLQDLCFLQPAVIVGLIATMTGCALQDDIVAFARALFRKGQDILATPAALPPRVPAPHDQAPSLSTAAAPCPAPV